jgi:hypothetical protein
MIRENRKQSALPCFFRLRDEFNFRCEDCCFFPISVFSVVAQIVTQLHSSEFLLHSLIRTNNYLYLTTKHVKTERKLQVYPDSVKTHAKLLATT